MGAIKELWWVIIMIGGPALCIVLREWYFDRQWKKQWRFLTNWESLGVVISEGVKEGYSDQVAHQRQVRKDDRIFATVEEFRNDVG